jgi:hypothetical protein
MQPPLDRRNQILLTPCHLVRPHQSSHLYWRGHKTKESGEKEKKDKTLQQPPTQAVRQEGQHLSPQSTEYQGPLSGLDTKGITPHL